MVKSWGVEVVRGTLGEKKKSEASVIKDFLECIETIEKDGQAIQQKLRDKLTKRPRFEEIDAEVPSAGELLRLANITLSAMALQFRVIYDEMVGDFKSREVIETPRKAVSLTLKPIKHSIN